MEHLWVVEIQVVQMKSLWLKIYIAKSLENLLMNHYQYNWNIFISFCANERFRLVSQVSE